MAGECFFHRVDADRYESTEWTRGPWSPLHQHAGPPSALLGGRLAELIDHPFRVARVAVEVTRPVPIGPLTLERALRRDGRSVKALVGRLLDADGKQVLSMDALAIAEAPLDVHLEPATLDEASPAESPLVEFPFHDGQPGYSAAMELRFGRGEFGLGDVMAWMRARVLMLDDAPPTPLERVLIAADSGNGVSQRVSTREYSFVNPDLTVTLHRLPIGDWIGLAARTEMDDRGVGLADTRLYDETGPIGRGVQTLVIRKRELSAPRDAR